MYVILEFKGKKSDEEIPNFNIESIVKTNKGKKH